MQRTLKRAIRNAIKTAGISQNEWARTHDLTPSQLSRLVNGHIRVSGDAAMKLQKATGIDARAFLSVSE